jgi:hypothetical protein
MAVSKEEILDAIATNERNGRSSTNRINGKEI